MQQEEGKERPTHETGGANGGTSVEKWASIAPAAPCAPPLAKHARWREPTEVAALKKGQVLRPPRPARRHLRSTHDGDGRGCAR
eukprot:2326206-Pleurochrysis_carterae.AAC.1